MRFSKNALRFLFSPLRPRYAISESGVGRGSDSDTSGNKESSPKASTGYSSIDAAIKNTPPKPKDQFNLTKLKANSHWYDEKTARAILEMFCVHPHMIALVLTLRRIYYDEPDECPIQILLIVSTLEFVVAYGTRKKSGTDIEPFIEFIREQWALVGKYINLGQVPKGNRVLHLLAFCTFECINNEVGSDGLDKMLLDNHTLEFADYNILHDYLKAAGYECTKEDARNFASEYMTKSDTWIESGLVGKGNKWAVYEEQVNARFVEFCSKFEQKLLVPNGPSVIDQRSYHNFEGVHIVAAAGLLNVILAALLTFDKHGQRPHLLVASTRAAKLLFDCKGHKFDVIESQFIVICPHIHPNEHQQYLSKYETDEHKKMDHSYSTALRPLDGVKFNVGGSQETFRENLVDSTEQRAGNQSVVRSVREEHKALNDPEIQETKAQLDEHKRLERRASKQQRVLERQEKKKVKK